MAFRLISEQVLSTIDEKINNLDTTQREQCVKIGLSKIRNLGMVDSTSLDEDNAAHLERVLHNYSIHMISEKMNLKGLGTKCSHLFKMLLVE